MKHTLRAFFAIICLLFSSGLFADSTDWSHPSTADTYTAWPSKVKDLARTAAMMDFTGDSNIPTGVIRYNATTWRLEKYNGTTWDALDITNLHDGAVSSAAKLADSVVTSAKILDATIANGDIANSTIQGGKIATDTITASNIGADAIGSSELADNAVDTNAIAASAVTATKASFQFTSCSCGIAGGGLATISSITTNACGRLSLGNVTFYYFQCDFTVSVSTTNQLTYTLPVTPVNNYYLIHCIADGNTGVPARLSWSGSGGAAAAVIARLDGATWTIGSSRSVKCSGFYEN